MRACKGVGRLHTPSVPPAVRAAHNVLTLCSPPQHVQRLNRIVAPKNRPVPIRYYFASLAAIHAVGVRRPGSNSQRLYAAGTDVAGTADDSESQESAEDESLRLLEWPAVCRQVGCFCRTVMGAERVGAGGLPMGLTQQESERLLQETAEAMEAQLEFDGVYDIRPAAEVAQQDGFILNAKQLEAIGTTLKAALQLREAACSCMEASGQPRFPALHTLAQGIQPEEHKTADMLHRCFQYGSVTDAASDTLAAIRAQRRSNLDRLKQDVQQWANTLKARGACEDATYTIVRDRYCIGIKSGRQSELPKGSVRLGASGSGATIYMEPAPLVELNNHETLLAQRQKNEEAVVMAIMTRLVGERAGPLLSLMESVTLLDMAAARARHAQWLSATCPRFVSQASCAAGPASTSSNARDAQGSITGTTTSTTTSSSSSTTTTTTSSSSSSSSSSSAVPSSSSSSSSAAPSSTTTTTSSNSSSSSAAPSSTTTTTSSSSSAAPSSTTTATTSSSSSSAAPSTTTATTTTSSSSAAAAASARGALGSLAGLVSLLALPGARHPVLMQPVLPPLPSPPSVQDHRFDRDFMEAPMWEKLPTLAAAAADQRGGAGAGMVALPKPLHLCVPEAASVVAITGPNTGGKTATIKTAGLLTLMAKAGLFVPTDPAAVELHGQPCLYWFDKVLADLGDAQSLQQSLSTFSGHVKRIQKILTVATPRSLVLLDEVGSGTDPSEGAALARSILDHLAATAALTMATTHHAVLKSAAQEDERYVNVSMEFDVATLSPTYKLNWGVAGSSNALDTAERLSFDSTVVKEARSIVQELRRAQEAESKEALAQSVVQQIQELRNMGVAAKQRRLRSEKQLKEVSAALKKSKERLSKAKDWKTRLAQRRAELVAELESVVERYSSGQMELQEAEAVFRRHSQDIMRSLM